MRKEKKLSVKEEKKRIFLHTLGFKRRWIGDEGDRDAFEYIRYFKVYPLKNLYIIIGDAGDDTISIWCDSGMMNAYGQVPLLIKKYSEKYITKIVNNFTK